MVTQDLPSIRLEEMCEEDAEFVLGVRNALSTLSNLHDARTFSNEEFVQWFRENSPEWLTIKGPDGGSVGYVRTRWHDEARTELFVGIDIHPDHRRNGYARAAYTKLFERLIDKMVTAVRLEVLDHNAVAFGFYRRLGFEVVGERPYENGFGSVRSIEMRKSLQRISGKNCKVIASWLGSRRAWAGLNGAEVAYEMYRFLLDRELELDPGVPCDTVVVINMPPEGDLRLNPWFRKAHEMILRHDGARTKSGRVRVMERPNIGISFGAFDHAFNQLWSEYDFWHFMEDDHIVLHDDCLRRDVLRFKEIGTNVGFVASVGCSTEHAPHCHGACGVTSRSILQGVKADNYSQILGRGHLPFWYSLAEGAEGHEVNAEVRFTNEIHRRGLDLVDSCNRKFLLNWRATELRNCHGEADRLVPWTPDLAA